MHHVTGPRAITAALAATAVLVGGAAGADASVDTNPIA